MSARAEIEGTTPIGLAILFERGICRRCTSDILRPPSTPSDPLLVFPLLFTIARDRRVRFLDALAKFSTIPNSTFDFKKRETRCLFISNLVRLYSHWRKNDAFIRFKFGRIIRRRNKNMHLPCETPPMDRNNL